ncbi:MAG: LamG-like jellyroll fold domain-containing protein, partial [Bacteroidia bacterium]
MKTKKLLAATAALLLTGSVNSQSCATHCPAFNGTTSYVSTINSLGTSGTLEAWIYLNSLPDGVTSLGAEIFNTSTTFDQSQTDLYIDPSGHLVLANYNTGANDHFYLTGSTVLSTGKWYHVAGTWETNSSNLTANVYVNGCYDGTYGPSSAHTWDNTGSPSLLAIGGWPASVAHYGSTPWALDGMIDEARSWSVARTQCQIADNMEQLDFFGSDHASLQCYYQFNESTLPTTPPKTEDSFSGNNDGTLVNIGSWPASAAPVISWNTSPYNRVSSSCMQMYSGNISSVLFNGSTNYVTTNSYHPGTSGSMEAWINMSSLPDGVTSYGAEIFNTSITYDQTQTDLFVTTGGNLVLSNYNTTANNYLTLNGSTVLSAGQWYHVAATWETSGGNVTAYLYVNGCLDGTYGPSSAHTWDN